MPRFLLSSISMALFVACLISLCCCGGENSSTSTTDQPDVHDIKTVISKFRSAWNSNNSIDLENTYEGNAVGVIAQDLATDCTRYGWDITNLPKISEGIQKGSGSSREVTFPIGTDGLDVMMEEREEGWVVVKIKTRVSLKLKDIADVVNDFAKAWNESDYDAVYGALTPTMFEKKKSFVRLFKSRGWDSELPKIDNPATEKVDEYQYKTTFFIGDAGELQCKWIVEGGKWGLRTLRPPKK